MIHGFIVEIDMKRKDDHDLYVCDVQNVRFVREKGGEWCMDVPMTRDVHSTCSSRIPIILSDA